MYKKNTAMSLTDFLGKFPNESSARAYLEQKHWADGIYCPSCNSKKIGRHGRDRSWHRCCKCGKAFNVKTDTIFERSKIPPHDWLLAFYMILTARKSVSSMHNLYNSGTHFGIHGLVPTELYTRSYIISPVLPDYVGLAEEFYIDEDHAITPATYDDSNVEITPLIDNCIILHCSVDETTAETITGIQRGPVGPAPNILVNETTASEDGTAEVIKREDLGNELNQYFDFVLPKGNKGDKGDKGDTLTAGANIQIDDNVISATDTVYDDTELRNAISEESQARSETDSNLQTQIEALQGAIIYLGNINLSTAQITANTALLTQWAQANGFYPLKTGYVIIDSQANDWWWNGTAWVNIGYYEVATATNTSKGVVKGSTADLKVSVDASGEMSVNGLQAKLDNIQLTPGPPGPQGATGPSTIFATDVPFHLETGGGISYDNAKHYRLASIDYATGTSIYDRSLSFFYGPRETDYSFNNLGIVHCKWDSRTPNSVSITHTDLTAGNYALRIRAIVRTTTTGKRVDLYASIPLAYSYTAIDKIISSWNWNPTHIGTNANIPLDSLAWDSGWIYPTPYPNVDTSGTASQLVRGDGILTPNLLNTPAQYTEVYTGHQANILSNTTGKVFRWIVNADNNEFHLDISSYLPGETIEFYVKSNTIIGYSSNNIIFHKGNRQTFTFSASGCMTSNTGITHKFQITTDSNPSLPNITRLSSNYYTKSMPW